MRQLPQTRPIHVHDHELRLQRKRLPRVRIVPVWMRTHEQHLLPVRQKHTMLIQFFSAPVFTLRMYWSTPWLSLIPTSAVSSSDSPSGEKFPGSRNTAPFGEISLTFLKLGTPFSSTNSPVINFHTPKCGCAITFPSTIFAHAPSFPSAVNGTPVNPSVSTSFTHL